MSPAGGWLCICPIHQATNQAYENVTNNRATFNPNAVNHGSAPLKIYRYLYHRFQSCRKLVKL